MFRILDFGFRNYTPMTARFARTFNEGNCRENPYKQIGNKTFKPFIFCGVYGRFDLIYVKNQQ